ncbi:hypothetical protein KEH51_05855 [[Brevibacterium] frigoritolerans]|uniref:Uncharacterized protein n=1 Tax=Peribacillus frigoritolerans TaxID=450367 RepID=A0A941FHG6_9BACI|nr:hypothetical protein [Peribacillus frigoritolerans]
MIFFAYDLEKYVQERGFWEDYSSSMPRTRGIHHGRALEENP